MRISNKNTLNINPNGDLLSSANVTSPLVGSYPKIARWANSTSRELDYTPVELSDGGLISSAQGLELNVESANPGNSDTVWLNSDGLNLGARPIVASTGVVSAGAIATFADATGHNIQSSTLSISSIQGSLNFHCYDSGDSFTGQTETIAYQILQIGNFCIFCLKRFKDTMTNVNHLLAGAGSIPAGYRPQWAEASATFLPIVDGGGDSEYDSDVIGLLRITSDGSVRVFREADPGTSEWNTAHSGWDEISLQYTVST